MTIKCEESEEDKHLKQTDLTRADRLAEKLKVEY